VASGPGEVVVSGGSKVDQLREMRERQVEAPPPDPETFYADRVTASLAKTAEGFIETGRWLIEEKGELPHGRWTGWIEVRLPIAPRTAREFMAIAEGLKRRDGAVLPPSKKALLELARLDDDEWEAVRPKLSPELTRRELRSILGDGAAETPSTNTGQDDVTDHESTSSDDPPPPDGGHPPSGPSREPDSEETSSSEEVPPEDDLEEKLLGRLEAAALFLRKAREFVGDDAGPRLTRASHEVGAAVRSERRRRAGGPEAVCDDCGRGIEPQPGFRIQRCAPCAVKAGKADRSGGSS